MNILVQKFGGTSVGNPERIRAVADLLLKSQQEGKSVVSVISAMAGETNRLVGLANSITCVPRSLEYDMLLAAGEQQAIALVALAINARGGKAVPLLGHQVGIQTDSALANARIQKINTRRLRSLLNDNVIPVIAGFQGVDAKNNITTLGRGGSDTTAVAVAAALHASDCEIFTDVDGVYTTDPRLCRKARKLANVHYDEMIEMASLGAKVLQIRSVEMAANFRVPLHVRSSFNLVPGTRIVGGKKTMEACIVRGIAAENDNVKVTLNRVPDSPAALVDIFGPLADSGVVVDGMVQYQTTKNKLGFAFTVLQSELATVKRLLQTSLGAKFAKLQFETQSNLAKVSLIGMGIRNHPEVSVKTFRVLAQSGIKIFLTNSSEIKVSVIVASHQMQACVQTLHRAFGLDA